MRQRGFTLIELLVVVAIIGALASMIIIAVNPGRQLAKARDSQRRSDLFSILTSLYQYSAEHSGALPDTDGDPNTSDFPTSLTCIGIQSPCYNLGVAGEDDTMVPDYMPSIPLDPKTGTDENTGYFIYVDANNRVVASASGEVETAIVETR